MEAVFTVDRGGETVDLTATIATAQRPVLDDDGNPTEEFITAGYVGLAPEFAWVSQPWTAVPQYMWDLTVQVRPGPRSCCRSGCTSWSRTP